MTFTDKTILRQRASGQAALLSQLASLPKAERQVADAVIADPIESMRGSIGELAARSATSAATVIRLARRLGYTGFADWKLALAEEHGRSSQFGHPDPPANADAMHPLDYTLEDDAAALRAARRLLDPTVFNQVVERLVGADDVLFVGVGTSGSLAELSAYRFAALGIRASAIRDTLAQHLAASNLGPESLVIALSHTGSSKATIGTAQTARQRQAIVVGITSSARSPLADIADLVLVTGGDGAPRHLDVFANRVVHLSVLGALHTATSISLAAPEKGTESARIVATHQF